MRRDNWDARLVLSLFLLAAPVSAQVIPGNGSGGNVSTNSGAANRCALFSGTTTLTSDSGCTYSGTGATFVLAVPLLSSVQGSIAASAPFINHTATWSTTATYDDIVTNITDSGPSNAASTVFNAKIGGVSVFNVTKAGSVVSTGSYTIAAGGSYRWSGRILLFSPANGQFQFQNSGGTANFYAQVGTTGTVPAVAGFGTSPSTVAGSRDSVGQVNVGTGGVATTGTIAFNVTWVAAPICIVQPTIGFVATHATATTTVMTITGASAWGASEILNWHCFAAN